MAETWNPVHLAAVSGLALAVGFALARAYLAALALNVRLYLTPGAAWRAVGLHIGRFAGIVASFAIAAVIGAPAVLAMLAGFTLGRAFGLGRHQ